MRIGPYDIVGRLAIGGEGREVLLGKSPAGQPVAIKKVPRGIERRSTARHPNLVDVLELVQIGDERYRIMEYLEGENLAGLIRRLIKRHERISFGLAAHLVAEICDGLHAAHAAGELHRALTPETVFITYGGELKLLELGGSLANPESLYRSPEQAGSRPLGRQSDVYSAALVLYELTTLRRVFSDARELGAGIPPPSTQTESYPPQLDAICMQALSHDPAERFVSAAAMRDALLVTARTLDSSGDPAQALASKLMRLFGDRIAAKRELLDRVRAGVPLGDVVPTEVDEDIEVPGIVRDRAPSQGAGHPGEPVTARPELPATLPAEPVPDGLAATAADAPARFRWGVLLLFVLAIAVGGAAGAWLRLYSPWATTATAAR